MRQLLVAALALAACSNPSSKGGPEAAGSGSAGSGSAAADPWSKPAPPKEPDTPERRQARAEAALERVNKILPEVAKLRALSSERTVPTRYQLPGEFRDFVRREIARELPPERSHNLSEALAHLGFLVKPLDIATVEEQAMTTQ